MTRPYATPTSCKKLRDVCNYLTVPFTLPALVVNMCRRTRLALPSAGHPSVWLLQCNDACSASVRFHRQHGSPAVCSQWDRTALKNSTDYCIQCIHCMGSSLGNFKHFAPALAQAGETSKAPSGFKLHTRQWQSRGSTAARAPRDRVSHTDA